MHRLRVAWLEGDQNARQISPPAGERVESPAWEGQELSEHAQTSGVNGALTPEFPLSWHAQRSDVQPRRFRSLVCLPDRIQGSPIPFALRIARPNSLDRVDSFLPLSDGRRKLLLVVALPPSDPSPVFSFLA